MVFCCFYSMGNDTILQGSEECTAKMLAYFKQFLGSDTSTDRKFSFEISGKCTHFSHVIRKMSIEFREISFENQKKIQLKFKFFIVYLQNRKLNLKFL